MRITGGTLTGRKIYCPKGVIRPAMDRMRESVFSILGNLEGLKFLDLFSGSGVIGLEAVSRGAVFVICVEKDRGKRDILKKNIAMTAEIPQDNNELEDSVTVPKIDMRIDAVERFLLLNRDPFDIIFMDPPFPYKFRMDLLKKVAGSKALHPGSEVLIHYPEEAPLPESVKAPKGAVQFELKRTDLRKYGRSVVSFYTAHEI